MAAAPVAAGEWDESRAPAWLSPRLAPAHSSRFIGRRPREAPVFSCKKAKVVFPPSTAVIPRPPDSVARISV